MSAPTALAPAPPSPPAAGRLRTVLALGTGQLLSWASSYYLVTLLAPPMAAAFGLPAVAVYGMFSGALVVAAVVGPFTGRRIDKVGGRRVLLASNLLFALALGVMALAPNAPVLGLGWALLGVAMPMGLYDAAFSTLVGRFGAGARKGITGITLIAGFASSLGWPLTGWLAAHHGWRAACAVWAGLHLVVGFGLVHGWWLPRAARPGTGSGAEDPAGPATLPLPEAAEVEATLPGAGVGEGAGDDEDGELAPAPPVSPPRAVPAPAVKPVPTTVLWTLAFTFAASGFVFAGLAAHLPRLLVALGTSPGQAVVAASLVGVSQVLARLLDLGPLRRLPPLVSAAAALTLHPLGAALLWAGGAKAAAVFTVLHGAGVGWITVIKGTLPLALFGAAGFGRRAGLLEAPARVSQAVAPLLFGLAVDGLGGEALVVTAALNMAGFAAVLGLGLRQRRQARAWAAAPMPPPAGNVAAPRGST